MATLAVMGSRPRPYVMAHRGNLVHCPENTLVAFRRAIDEGADVIETDLHVSADGEFMCIHDGMVDRTTNGSGAVKTMTCPELQQLSASYGRPEYASETIPTLRQLLAILPAETAVALELKCDDFLDAQVCRHLLDLLQKTNTLNQAVVLSFSRARLAKVRQATPQIPIGLITLSRLLPEGPYQLIGPLWPILVANPLYVWLAHRRGQLVAPLDPTPEPRLWYYRLLGCDAVLSNDPGKTLRALGR